MTYTISYECGCRIIRGQLPLSEVSQVISGFSGQAVADHVIAPKLNAVLVIGEPEAIAKLRRRHGLGG